MTYVPGRHATAEDILACIAAIRALHDALVAVPKHPFLDRDHRVYGRADRGCWADRPASVSAPVAPLVHGLYALRRSIDGLCQQLAHGNLNPENIRSPRSGARPNSRWPCSPIGSVPAVATRPSCATSPRDPLRPAPDPRLDAEAADHDRDIGRCRDEFGGAGRADRAAARVGHRRRFSRGPRTRDVD